MESLLANPRLSRFDPLELILCYDDFDAGLNGWTGLIGNYEDSLDSMLPDYQDLRVQPIGHSGKTVSHFHLGPEGWEDVPGEPQLLCYNEIATKMNWHYLRIGLDLKRRAFTGFQCNDHTFGPEGMHCIELPAMANLWCMLNAAFWVEADMDKRAFLYIDSVLLSGESDQ